MINNNTIPNVIQNLTNQESEMDDVIKNYLTPASIILFIFTSLCTYQYFCINRNRLPPVNSPRPPRPPQPSPQITITGAELVFGDNLAHDNSGRRN